MMLWLLVFDLGEMEETGMSRNEGGRESSVLSVMR